MLTIISIFEAIGMPAGSYAFDVSRLGRWSPPALILGGIALALNRGELKAHRFPAGEPSGACEIHLAGQPQRTIWLSERLVGVTTPSR